MVPCPTNYPIDAIDRLKPIMLSGFVVAEVKSPCNLSTHVPQTAVEMYGYAKALALAPSLPVCFFVSLNDYPTIGGTSSVGPSQQGTSGFFSSLQ